MPKPTPVESREATGPTSQQVTTSFDEELALDWYVQALQRRWISILVVALLAAAAGFALASLRPVLFEAVTTLLVVPPPRTPTAQINPATFRAILENASLASQVIAETGLPLTPQTFLEDVLVVEQPQGTNVVRIKVRLGNPKQAADASRRLARGAILLTRRLNQDEKKSSLQEQLKNHLTAASVRMVTAEKELLNYQQSAQVELLKEDTQAMLDERGDLLKLIVSIESEKSRVAKALEELKKQERVLPVRRDLGAEESLRRTDATTEVLDTSSPFINPVYQSLEFQIANSRTKLAGLEEQRRQVVDVRKIGGQELARLSELHRRQIELAQLQSSFDLAKKVYGDLAVRYEESRTQSLGFSPQLQLVDEAIVPDRPLSRQRTRFLALGLVLGLLTGAAAVLLLESRN